MNFRLSLRLFSLVLILLTSSLSHSITLEQTIPSPILALTNVEAVESEKKPFVRYYFKVENYEAYPAELFAPAPALPPCGLNKNASRTWVDFYDSSGKRLYGFCALAKPADLTKLWFALDADVVPPSYVYIELTDRQTGAKYKSNLAETTQ